MDVSSIRSTRGHSLDLDALRGKTVVIFYEGRDHTEDNAELKASCAQLMERGSTRGRFEVLGVAAVKGLSMVRPVVTAAVKRVARRHGAELWLDFEGALEDTPIARGSKGSTVAVIGPDGELAFRADGRLDARDVERFFAALSAPLDGAPARAA